MQCSYDVLMTVLQGVEGRLVSAQPFELLEARADGTHQSGCQRIAAV